MDPERMPCLHASSAEADEELASSSCITEHIHVCVFSLLHSQRKFLGRLSLFSLEEGKRTPPPHFPVLLRADFVLTKDARPLYYKVHPCLFYHKSPFVRPFWVLSKDEISP